MVIPPGVPFLTSIYEKFSKLSSSGIEFSPYVQTGFTHVGSNLNLPIQAGAGLDLGELRVGDLDVVLNDGNVWTGVVGLNAILTPKIVLFGTATAYAPRQMSLKGTLPISVGPVGVDPSLTLTVSNFEYWNLSCGVAYGIGGGGSLVLGSSWDRTALSLSDPRIGSVALANQTIKGEVQLKHWIPYIGLQLVQKHYNALLLYSPLAYGTGTISLRSNQTAPHQLEWRLRQLGYFLAFAAQYNLPVPPPMTASLAFNAGLINVKGDSTLEYDSPTFRGTRDVTAQTTNYAIGGALSLALVF
jgi:hypothetical protein